MNKVTDLTTRKLGSKFNGKLIEPCPKCGRPGTISKFDGPRNSKYLSISHKIELIWNGQAAHVTDSCHVSATLNA